MCFAHSFLIFHHALEKLRILLLWGLCFGKGIATSTSAEVVVAGEKIRDTLIARGCADGQKVF